MPKKSNKRTIELSEQEANIIISFVGAKIKWMRKQGDLEMSVLSGPSQFYDVANVSEEMILKIKEAFNGNSK